MALRMMLTAMVVSMSLPLPSADSCRNLVQELNRELAAALSDVGTEIVTRLPDGSELMAVTGSSLVETESASSPNPDEAFAQILNDFVDEAVKPEIEQAANDARRIPLEPVDHPLPPATEALDVLPSVDELIQSVREEIAVKPVDSATAEWLDVLAGKCRESVAPDKIDILRPVVSEDIGPWDLVLEADPIAQPDTTEATPAAPKIVTAVSSMTPEWTAIVEGISLESTTEIIAEKTIRDVANTTPPTSETGTATIRDAFRKTTEAIALWSKVLTKPY